MARAVRSRLARTYHEIDFDILWDAYAVEVPTMRAALAADIEVARAWAIAAAEGETSPEEQP